jgi:hypothetical protein
LTAIREGVPAFEGLVLHEDRQWYYSFWYPKGWVPHALSSDRIGVLCSPTEEDVDTFFSVEVIPLEATVQPDDLPLLCEGVQEGLSLLPSLTVESAEESAASSQVTIERIYTFEDQGVTRKRRVRLIYKGDRLYSLMSQGATVAEYAYWLPMLNYCHLTFELGLFDPARFAGSGVA